MPRIEEYLPEVDASGPVGGVSPNLDQIGMEGRGLQEFGADTESGYDYLERRQQMAETSDAFAAISYKRADLLDQIEKQTNDGTLDTEQLKNQYNDWVDDQADRFHTPGGRDMFNKQAARLGGFMLQKAMRGQTVIASNNAKGDFVNGLNLDTSTLEKDPSQFESVHMSQMQHIETLAQDQHLNPAQKLQFQMAAGKQLSQAAIRGYMNMDYNSAVGQAQDLLNKGDANSIPKAAALETALGTFNQAKQMLAKGGFDQYLNENDKKSLSNEADMKMKGAFSEINRLITVKKSAQAEAGEAWEQQALPKLVNGGLSAKDVFSSPLTADKKYQWIEKINAASNDITTNPALKNSLIQRTLLPDNDPKKIQDPSELLQHVGHGISIRDYTQIKGFMDKSPDGQVLNGNRKMLLDMAKKKLTVNPITLKADGDGEYRMMQFTNALAQEEQARRKQGTPIGDLYDPNNKDFFGKKIGQYQQTLQDAVKAMAGPTPAPSPVAIQSPPGLPPQATPAPKKMPPAGLDFEGFKKWKKANGG